MGGSADGTGAAASFWAPAGISIDTSGNLSAADANSNNEIRKITRARVATTLAGSTQSVSADGTLATATFNNPFGVAVDGRSPVQPAKQRQPAVNEASESLKNRADSLRPSLCLIHNVPSGSSLFTPS